MTKVTGMMEKNAALFTGKHVEYITPKKLFQALDAEFHFILDPCTSKDNPLDLPIIFTEEDNGLTESWQYSINNHKAVYVNPPYNNVKDWVKKAFEECTKGATVVMLLAARTDTKWFHEYVYKKAEVRFIRGRLKFEGKYGKANTAPFPSMLVIFRPP
jgi:site-specific DNA-methyltransferase (adenine-specific)